MSEEYTNYPHPIQTGLKSFYFRCSVPGCMFQCRKYLLYFTHVEEIHECEDCSLYILEKKNHRCKTPGLRGGHVDRGKQLDLGVFQEYSRAHKGTLISYIYNVTPSNKFVGEVFESIKPSIINIYQQLLNIYESIFSYTAVKVIMERERDGEWIEASAYFRSENEKLFNEGEIEKVIESMSSNISEKIADYTINGSGWRVKSVENLELKVADLRYFIDARGKKYLKMPFYKRGYLNILNKDENCFEYCCCAALHMKDVPPGTSFKFPKVWEQFIPLHDFSDVLNKEIDIHRDIDRFEIKNSVTVNVFSHREKHVLPVRRSRQRFNTAINLFLIEEVRDGQKLYHYVLITDLDKFLSNIGTRGTHLCHYCFREFRNEEAQIKHSVKCRDDESAAITKELWPEDWKKLQFYRYEMTLPFPYILHYDFETYSSPLNSSKGKSTTVNAEYIPASFSLVIVRQGLDHSTLVGVEYYDGPNLMQTFFERLFKWGQRIINQVRLTNNAVNPSDETLKRHREAEFCMLCHREFDKPSKKKKTTSPEEMDWEEEEGKTKKKVIKTFHHNHHTGQYEGALCQGCNLKVKYKSELVCIAHNSTGFDIHLLVQALDCPLFDAKDIDVIAKNSERFIQMTLVAKNTFIKELFNPIFNEAGENSWLNRAPKVRLRFIDSFQFLNSSLRTLTENLRKENSPYFSLVKEAFPVMLNQPGREAIRTFKCPPGKHKYRVVERVRT